LFEIHLGIKLFVYSLDTLYIYCDVITYVICRMVSKLNINMCGTCFFLITGHLQPPSLCIIPHSPR